MTKVHSHVLATLNSRELAMATGLSFSANESSQATQFILNMQQ
jgi:hypothetical protein